MFNKKLRIAFIFIALVFTKPFVGFATPLESTLHLFMVADIQDASIGETCVLDKHKVDRMFRSVALAADLKFDLVSHANYFPLLK